MLGGPQPNQHQRIYQASWLFKHAEWRFAWDRRFFIQDGLRLSYRLTELGPEKKAGYVSSLQRVVGPPQLLAFRVWLKEGGCWTLRANTEEEYRQWTEGIATALLKDAAEESLNVREGFVLKKAAWTGQWRRRYIELDGHRLAYRERKEDEMRNRFVLVAVDESGEEGGEDRLFVTTSCGERFWIKFMDVKQCDDWKGVIIRGLQHTVSWHWTSLVPTYTSEYIPLRVQHHATAAGDGAFVYCYGGTPKVTSQWLHCQTSKTVLPDVRREKVARQLSRIQLAGEHTCTAFNVLPFEESAHAKLLPPPLLGAAMCVLKTTGLSSSSSISAAANPSLECLLLFGGRGETFVSCEVEVETWWCVLRGASSQWQRNLCDADVLPRRTFHTLATRGPRKAVIVGGLDDLNRVCGDCFLLSWPDFGENTFTTSPIVEFFGFLPTPRAFHVCLSLCDTSLLVLGGCGMGDNELLNSVLRLPAAESEWHEVMVEPPLPHLEHVCAAGTTSFSSLMGEELVFVLGEMKTSHSILRLFQLTLQSTHADSREIILAVGAIPRRCCGAKMHYAAGYLYVIGGCYDDKQCEDPNGTLSFQDPVRMLIGDDKG